MPKFKHKPTVIEAIQFNHVIKDYAQMCEAWPLFRRKTIPACPMPIEALAGTMFAQLGDWIVRDPAGEFWPIKPDTFEAIFESVEEEWQTLNQQQVNTKLKAILNELNADNAYWDWDKEIKEEFPDDCG